MCPSDSAELRRRVTSGRGAPASPGAPLLCGRLRVQFDVERLRTALHREGESGGFGVVVPRGNRLERAGLDVASGSLRLVAGLLHPVLDLAALVRCRSALAAGSAGGAGG